MSIRDYEKTASLNMKTVAAAISSLTYTFTICKFGSSFPTIIQQFALTTEFCSVYVDCSSDLFMAQNCNYYRYRN